MKYLVTDLSIKENKFLQTVLWLRNKQKRGNVREIERESRRVSKRTGKSYSFHYQENEENHLQQSLCNFSHIQTKDLRNKHDIAIRYNTIKQIQRNQ